MRVLAVVALLSAHAPSLPLTASAVSLFSNASLPTPAPLSRRLADACTIERGVDYAGNDIGNAPGATPESCCATCAQTSGCGAFSWSSFNGGTCWLKSGRGATKTNANVHSAVVSSPSPAPSCALETGVDYVANDIGSVAGASAQDCCAKCSQRAGCGAFSWSSFNGGTCWLKSARGQIKANAQVTSGTITAASTCAAIERGVDYKGNDIGSQPGASVNDCCGKCSAFAGCSAFSWSGYNGGTCWLKSGRGATAANANVHSGTVPSAAPTPTTAAPAPAPGQHIQARIRRGEVKAISVNLGSWLVGEYWMSTTSPAWKDAVENGNQRGWGGEYITMKYLGQDKGTAAFEAHRQSWITEKDIAEIASRGLNTVRVPVGFWIVNDDPSTESTEISRVYAKGALKYLDKLVNEWAVKYNLAVMLSLHSHQGSQNGYDHSAPQQLGTTSWSDSQDNVRNSLQFATYLAARYRSAQAFLGLQLMNEPSYPTNYDVLWDYYKKAYEQIRATGNDCIIGVSPMIQEQSPPIMDWFMPKPQYYNVWHEFHVYYKWGENEGNNEAQIISRARTYRANHLDNWKGNPIYMGEWSLAAPDSAPFSNRDQMKEFAAVQLDQLSGAKSGWAFWSWRHDEELSKLSQWSMRQLLREGIFTVPRA
ncbi:hypothetical protein PINS_up022162 [Pythium insidiosum]|nr:hypothetical protein PINS_up022162 [Pythium insidiosum]